MAYHPGVPIIAYRRSFLPFTAIYWSIIGLVSVVCAVAFGLRVKGRENLRKARHAVLVSNHTLVMDPGVIACALWPRRAYFTMLEETACFPLLGTFVRLLGGVPIPETAARLRALEHAVALGVRELGYVHFFPEGECFLWNQHLRPFHPGAFLVAARLGVPVLPLTTVLRERGRLLAALGRVFRARVPPRVTIVIGEPIMPKTDGELRRLAARVGELAVLARGRMQKTIEVEGGAATLFRGQMPRLAKRPEPAQAIEAPAAGCASAECASAGEPRWASGG